MAPLSAKSGMQCVARNSLTAPGGSCLLADAIRTHVNLREDRFLVAKEPQFALVYGLKPLVIGGENCPEEKCWSTFVRKHMPVNALRMPG